MVGEFEQSPNGFWTKVTNSTMFINTACIPIVEIHTPVRMVYIPLGSITENMSGAMQWHAELYTA